MVLDCRPLSTDEPSEHGAPETPAGLRRPRCCGGRLAAGQVLLVHPGQPLAADDLRPAAVDDAGDLHLVPGVEHGQPATLLVGVAPDVEVVGRPTGVRGPAGRPVRRAGPGRRRRPSAGPAARRAPRCATRSGLGARGGAGPQAGRRGQVGLGPPAGSSAAATGTTAAAASTGAARPPTAADAPAGAGLCGAGRQATRDHSGGGGGRKQRVKHIHRVPVRIRHAVRMDRAHDRPAAAGPPDAGHAG